MERVRTLVVGAGITGLATAGALMERGERDVLLIEADTAIGGYCKTVTRAGFVWDYSGHFFHFKHADIEAWLRERMPGQRIRKVEKKSSIDFEGHFIDFPFQKNIHQLPQPDFIECLHDLYFARAPAELRGESSAPQERNFQEMLYSRFGKAIAEKFLIPYNEKLYATDLRALDKDAMGRFFPHANLTEVVRNMKTPDNASYNASFTYPEGGAIAYVNALATAVPNERIALEEGLVSVDLVKKVATTSKRTIAYERLVSSAPFDRLLRIAGVPHDASTFSWNKVLVFNFGFDRKGPRDVHWIYYPSRAVSFYRVGFYDNIFEADRLSIYVEVGFARDAVIDVDATRKRVLDDLRKTKVITDHEIVAQHSVIMDPAYVHITQKSIAEYHRLGAELRAHDVHSIGRYGGWTYCSIEDNIVEARALAASL